MNDKDFLKIGMFTIMQQIENDIEGLILVSKYTSETPLKSLKST